MLVSQLWWSHRSEWAIAKQFSETRGRKTAALVDAINPVEHAKFVVFLFGLGYEVA